MPIHCFWGFFCYPYRTALSFSLRVKRETQLLTYPLLSTGEYRPIELLYPHCVAFQNGVGVGSNQSFGPGELKKMSAFT